MTGDHCLSPGPTDWAERGGQTPLAVHADDMAAGEGHQVGAPAWKYIFLPKGRDLKQNKNMTF